MMYVGGGIGALGGPVTQLLKETGKQMVRGSIDWDLEKAYQRFNTSSKLKFKNEIINNALQLKHTFQY